MCSIIQRRRLLLDKEEYALMSSATVRPCAIVYSTPEGKPKRVPVSGIEKVQLAGIELHVDTDRGLFWVTHDPERCKNFDGLEVMITHS